MKKLKIVATTSGLISHMIKSIYAPKARFAWPRF